MTAAEITYITKTAEYTWKDKKTNTEIAKGRNMTTVFKNIEEYRINCLQRINNFPHNKLLRILKSTDREVEETKGDH
jgi:hypothetical protein